MIGTLVSGRVTDVMLRRGLPGGARRACPAVCYLGAAALLHPGLLGSHLTPAVWFDVGGAALLSAANPPLDAAELDIMPAGLWGRAESTRTVLRSLAQALAPLVFGGLADLIAGIAPEQAPIGTHPGVISPSAAQGLEISFLLLVSTRRGGRLLPVAGAPPTPATSPRPRPHARAQTSSSSPLAASSHGRTDGGGQPAPDGRARARLERDRAQRRRSIASRDARRLRRAAG